MQAKETTEKAKQGAIKTRDQATEKANELGSEAKKQAQPAIDQAKATYNQAADKAQSTKEDVSAKADELQKAAKDKSQPAIDEAYRLKDQATQKAQVSLCLILAGICAERQV